MSGAPHYAYRPQIDGLRALAVAGVLVEHFWLPTAPTGHLGVRLFFVISGFLITERLLDARFRVENGSSTVAAQGRAFFLRRALRLFPAYFLLLAMLLILNTGGIRDSALWHVFSLTNLWFAKVDDWSPWQIAHFWSLSVEEQFYLIWPWIILLLPRRTLGPAVMATIAAGILFRIAVVLGPLGQGRAALWVLTPAAFDALGAGALLALAVRAGRNIGPVTKAILPATILWGLVNHALHLGWLPDSLYLTYVLQDVVSTVAFVGLVARCHQDRQDAMGFVLSSVPFLGMGRISYGIYLYHLPVLAGLLVLIPDLGAGPRRFALAAAATLVIAAVSWKVLETPFLRLKRRTEERRESPTAGSS